MTTRSCPKCSLLMARCDFKFCPDCGAQLDSPSPSDATACSALSYADGSPVKIGDVVKINNATCTVLRMVPNEDGSPCMVACRIEGCGEIEHGVFADTFRKHSPQNANILPP